MSDDVAVVEAPAFLDGIPDEFHSAVSGFTDKAGLAKGYSELYTKMGSYAKLPTDETPTEERSAFYNKLGRPDTPDGYKLPDLPDGKEYDKELIGGMRTIAHEAGVSDGQFRKMVERYLGIERQKAELAEGEKNRLAQENDGILKTKWGAEYPANSALVQRACDELITTPDGKRDSELHDAFSALIEEKGLKGNPVFAQVFCRLGQQMLDDTFVKGSGQVGSKDADYKPQYSNPGSADMYAAGDDEESKKARAWHRAQGHTYSRSD